MDTIPNFDPGATPERWDAEPEEGDEPYEDPRLPDARWFS